MKRYSHMTTCAGLSVRLASHALYIIDELLHELDMRGAVPAPWLKQELIGMRRALCEQAASVAARTGGYADDYLGMPVELEGE